MNPTLIYSIFLPILLVLQACQPVVHADPRVFDGERAYKHVLTQVEMGPRVPGSEAHGQLVEWLQVQLEESGWLVEIQEGMQQGHPLRNVIARRGSGQPWTVLGAHYDSRMVADQDPDAAMRSQPVPGANDGASGVSVLLELANAISPELDGQIWLVFFDVEDQGSLPGWDWILGSRYFVENLAEKPDRAVIVDMIGDANLNIYQERNSNPAMTAEIWAAAAQSGYSESFIPEAKYSILDDHTPFLEAGIPAVDIIDFDYPYWHTTADTADKVSASSLEAVGKTLQTWLEDTQSLAK